MTPSNGGKSKKADRFFVWHLESEGKMYSFKIRQQIFESGLVIAGSDGKSYQIKIVPVRVPLVKPRKRKRGTPMRKRKPK